MDLVPVPWDSEFFGFPIARVDGQPDPAQLPRLAREAGVRCIYCFCPAGDLSAIRSAEVSLFRLADIRIVLEAQVGEVLAERPSAADGFVVDLARPHDLDDLRQIAAELSTYSRFALDPGFGKVQARRLYEWWMETSLDGRAELVIVARNAEHVLGFTTCRTHGTVSAMELVAVRNGATGAGVGTALIRQTAVGLQNSGCQLVEVATQGRNPRAVKFYERCGFRVRDVSLVYHRWVDPEHPS